jgi:hypothetical protein
MALLLIACSGDASARHQAAQSSVQVSAATASSSAASPTHADSLGRLIGRLAQLGGEFKRARHTKGWIYESQSTSIFAAIREFRDSAVVRLVDCLEDGRLSTTHADGRLVPVGAMCYQALRHVAYYESYEAKAGAGR